MHLIRPALAAGQFLLDLDALDMPTVFRRTLDLLIAQEKLPAEQRDAVETALFSREQQASTAIGHSVAVPHAYLDSIPEPLIVLVRLAHPLNLGAPDGIPTRFVFVLLGPKGRAAEHLDVLMQVARVMSDDQFRYDAGTARNDSELLAAFDRFLARTAPPRAPVEKKTPDGLRYTGRFAGGLLADARRRLPHYASDFADGLRAKTVSSTLFLFFACLAPAVTFGGLMYEATGGRIGAVEMILATALCGVLFALASGQPLVILGGTGPLLVFTGILYALCEQLGIAFLPTYCWVGLWTALLLIVLALTDASCLIRYFTRFTDEIFAALISLIFIVEAIKSLLGYLQGARSERVNHDVAFLSVLLAWGTFYVAMSLSRLRQGRYLRPRTREFLADFGPAIAVVSMSLLWMLFPRVGLAPLNVPETLQPSYVPAGQDAARSWLIDPFQAPGWIWAASVVPALLACVLVYLDQNISARLINNPEHRLRKGEAYHLDLTVVGVLIGVCSLLGLPWLVAATVRSLNHLRSLATVEEVVSPVGDRRERVIHVQENRLTGLGIHLLIGFSLLLLPYLQKIPMAVLYGLFLFMGVVSMKGNQFFERLSLWPMDRNLYPAAYYLRKVPLWTIHKFTLLQVVCLAVLWVVKISVLGILFPLFIALLVPIRFLAGRWFKPEHLAALDAEEEPEEEETHWAA